MRHTTIVAACAVTLATGCAGREPVLEPTLGANDHTLDCQALMIAHDDAINRAVHKQEVQDRKDGTDAVLGITGAILFWPALFFIDTKNAEGVEAQNLVQRASTLREMAQSKDCTLADWRAIPELREKPGPAFAADSKPETALSGGEIRSAFAAQRLEVLNGSMAGYRLEHGADDSVQSVNPGGAGAASGRWEVSADRYCVEAPTWRQGKRSCYRVYDRGDGEYRLEPGDPTLSHYAKRVDS